VREVSVRTRLLRALDAREQADLRTATEAYGRFMQLRVSVR
jgi:hypothetical protein